MTRILKLALTCLLIALISACASHHYTVVQPASESLTDYGVLEIADFKSNLKSAEAKELASLFAGRLYQAVMEYRAEHSDDRIYDEITRKTDQSENVLLMEGTVIAYEEGSRAKRYWIGMGAGKAYCTIQVVFRDKASGDELARTNFDGELMGGIFGGEADETVDGVVKAFLDYMEAYMNE